MKVVVTASGIRRFAHELESRNPGATFVHCESDDVRLHALLADADVLVSARCTADMLAAATGLRLLQVPGAGTEKLAPEVWASGITVANAFEHGRSIAEYVVMVMLALSHGLHRMDSALRSGVWSNPLIDPSLTLRRTLPGQLVGLVGYGHIGSAVADLASGLGMRVGAVRKSPWLAEDSARLDVFGGPEMLGRLLEESDFVVVVVPLDDSTRGMIDAEALRRMRPTAALINVARGEVVDEAALYEALRSGALAGAALDVWHRVRPTTLDVTPPSVYPFGELENVIMTPHVSGVSEDTFVGRARFIGENIARLARGEQLHNVVSATRGP